MHVNDMLVCPMTTLMTSATLRSSNDEILPFFIGNRSISSYGIFA